MLLRRATRKNVSRALREINAFEWEGDYRPAARQALKELLEERLQAEVSEYVGASRYEHRAGRRDYRNGHYVRHLLTQLGDLLLRVPRSRTIEPTHGPQVDVIAIAKTDLPTGTTLDGLGGFQTYGLCERHDVTRRDQLLPMGLAERCTLTRDVVKDQAISYADVSVPAGQLVDRLRAEQDELFPVAEPNPVSA